MNVEKIWVDFNEVFDGNRVWTSIRRMRGNLIPGVGEWVELFDADGDGCLARVDSVDGPIIYFTLDWDRWVAAPIASPALSAPRYFGGYVSADEYEGPMTQGSDLRLVS
jgi:hypothetical protein